MRLWVLTSLWARNTNRAAAILAELLAGENLIPGSNGEGESDARGLFDGYVLAANLLNNGPVVGKVLLDLRIAVGGLCSEG